MRYLEKVRPLAVGDTSSAAVCANACADFQVKEGERLADLHVVHREILQQETE